MNIVVFMWLEIDIAMHEFTGKKDLEALSMWEGYASDNILMEEARVISGMLGVYYPCFDMMCLESLWYLFGYGYEEISGSFGYDTVIIGYCDIWQFMW